MNSSTWKKLAFKTKVCVYGRFCANRGALCAMRTWGHKQRLAAATAILDANLTGERPKMPARKSSARTSRCLVRVLSCLLILATSGSVMAEKSHPWEAATVISQISALVKRGPMWGRLVQVKLPRRSISGRMSSW